MEIRAKKFKEFLSIVIKIGNEPSLKMNANGISTIVVDPAHVSIISAAVLASEDCIPDAEETEFTVDGPKLLKFVSSYKANDMIKVEAKDGRLHLSANGMKFKVAMLNPEKWTRFPTLGSKLNASLTFNVNDLKAVVNSKLGSVKFDSDGNTALAVAQSESDTIEVRGTSAGEPAVATYPEEYLSNALVGGQLQIRFGTDLPCMLSPVLDNMDVTIMVAPRIERD